MPKKRHSNWMLAIVSCSTLLTSANTHSQIWIEEIQRAELPATLIPSKRSKIELTENGQLGGSTNASIVGSQTYSGQYRISSDSAGTISINLISNDDVSNIQLKTFKLRYKGVTYSKFPATGLDSPGTGEDVYIGFTAILTPGASEGDSYPSYVIDVIEEN